MKRTFHRTLVFFIAGILMTAGLSVLAAQQQQIRTPKQTPFPKNPDYRSSGSAASSWRSAAW